MTGRQEEAKGYLNKALKLAQEKNLEDLIEQVSNEFLAVVYL